MNYEDEKYVPNYRCKDCKHLKRRGNDVQCPCFNHSKIEHYAAWFVSSREEVGFPCKMFEPSAIHVWDLKNYWTNYDNWYKDWIEYWNDGKMPSDDSITYFQIKGQEKECAYGIKWVDCVNGTMIDGNTLKAVKKRYYKQSRKSPIGYELVVDTVDGVELKGE